MLHKRGCRRPEPRQLLSKPPLTCRGGLSIVDVNGASGHRGAARPPSAIGSSACCPTSRWAGNLSNSAEAEKRPSLWPHGRGSTGESGMPAASRPNGARFFVCCQAHPARPAESAAGSRDERPEVPEHLVAISKADRVNPKCPCGSHVLLKVIDEDGLGDVDPQPF